MMNKKEKLRLQILTQIKLFEKTIHKDVLNLFKLQNKTKTAQKIYDRLMQIYNDIDNKVHQYELLEHRKRYIREIKEPLNECINRINNGIKIYCV